MNNFVAEDHISRGLNIQLVELGKHSNSGKGSRTTSIRAHRQVKEMDLQVDLAALPTLFNVRQFLYVLGQDKGKEEKCPP